MNQNQQLDIPIQPVEQPILCSPYEEPAEHWRYDTENGEAVKQPGRREAGIGIKQNVRVVLNLCKIIRNNGES